ncbi:PP2C family protein-serine/threonine phosphatase [Clostridium cibarium]|uniref:Serine/threonine-protein phosphatase n=1 Tax=Clostridium cibarium TaxID=2762247 RepID=A0ABR8PPV0_9CLOT|nr:protein phosphatase 2C domain-containing protein [Clostridium cibarium]MBD7910203.1 serine/threonine-protein phosphatase [Clostridium cibarium]
MNFTVGYDTDAGLRKKINQDALLIKTAKSPYGRLGLFIVCDGMGGLSSGELASATVINEMSRWFDEIISHIDFNTVDESDLYKFTCEQIMDLNNKIFEYGTRKDEKLGTTLTLCLFVNDKYYILQVGDSRVYKIANTVEQLTKDQTFVQREVDRGNITIEEAENHPRKNVLLQCVGARKEVEPVMVTGKLTGNEVFLICSDGFYRKLSNNEILNELRWNNLNNSEQIKGKVRKFIDLVKSREERDNITGVIIKVS